MRTIFIFFVIGLVIFCPDLEAKRRFKIAYLEITDKHTQMTGLGNQLKRVGFKGQDVTEKMKADSLKLSSFDLLIVGSFVLSDPAVQAWFRKEADRLRRFVTKGGIVIVYAQDTDFWDIEPWLPERAFLLRGHSTYHRLGYVDESHPLFRIPNPLGLERLNDQWGGGPEGPGHPLSWWTFRTARSMLFLAAQDEDGQNPWCLEAGWGKGRALFFACAPDKVSPEGKATETTRNLCDALVQNALTYGETVAAGRAHPLPEGLEIPKEEIDGRFYLREFTRKEEQEFSQQINAVVDKGARWLKQKQTKDGSWGTFHASNARYEVGMTALSLLALLSSGVNKYDPAIKKGFDFIYAHPPEFTYEIALTLMVMDLKAAPMYERFTLAKMSPDEREKYDYRRDLTPEEREFMQAMTDRLIFHHMEGGLWCYSPDVGGKDTSNGQFAVLGLKAASRCGMKITKGLWEDVLSYYVTYQAPSGPKVKVSEFKSFARDGTPKLNVSQARARPWKYDFGYPDPSNAKGSHTNIGICCLILTYEELAKRRSPAAAKYKADVREGVKDGLAWLTSNWCIDANPTQDKFYYYYYIYSLERVGSLLGKRFIGDHDWYREGAHYLKEKQMPDGRWTLKPGEWGSEIVNTAFALLFLKRSTPPPVITVGGG